MPELPEVETTLRGIEPYIINKKINDILVRQSSLRWEVPVKKLKENIVGKSFSKIKRRAKYLIFTSNLGNLIIHLGMSGSLKILLNMEAPNKHDHIDIKFEDKSLLRFTDPRRFGSFHWTNKATEHPLLMNLGPEPLGNHFSGEHLFNFSRGRKLPVKNFIMNSKTIAGIGNIYASESLFEAGIKPHKAAGKISLPKYENLAYSIKRILQESINLGGTSLKDFVGGEGKPGFYKPYLAVYGREGKKCKNCVTILKNIRIGQRSSVFCSNCQK